MVVVLLGHAEVGSTFDVTANGPSSPCSMQSIYRQNDCGFGNLLKIHLNQCNNGLCKAKLDGNSTKEYETSKCGYNTTVRVNTGYELVER